MPSSLPFGLRRYRLLLSSAAMLLAAAHSHAAPVTPEEALAKASSFLESRQTLTTRGIAPALTNVYTATGKTGDCFYVMADNDNGCFAVISADDRFPDVLAYSDRNGFPAGEIPENVAWWLGLYQQQISEGLAAPDRLTRSTTFPESRPEIRPLLTTTWDQTDPYNKLCPLVSGMRSVTGCLATAMAQVMNYHKWPDYPKGSNAGYTFDGTVLDWDNMLDSYTSGYTTTQANAVALLMLQCGRAVNMSYTSYMSGAQPQYTLSGLVNHFDYSLDARMELRDYYSASVWEDMVYSELEAKRPVLYGGQANLGGHAFVCDGYQNGYFHFNWGWSGYQDGYFRLNALNPDAGGTGSFEGGYNSDQVIFTNVYKNNGSTDRQYLLISTGPFLYQAAGANQNEGFVTTSPYPNVPGMIYNPLPYDFEMNMGLRITDTEGNTVTYAVNDERISLPSNYGYDIFFPEIPDLPDGSYHLFPAFQNPEYVWTDVKVLYGTQQYVVMTVENGHKSFSNPGISTEQTAGLVVSDPYSYAPLSPGQPALISYTVTNTGPGDYNGFLTAQLINPDDADDYSSNMVYVPVPAGESKNVEFSMTAPNGKTAVASVLDASWKTVSERFVLGLDGNATDTRLSARSLEVSITSPTSVNVIDPSTITLRVRNTSNATITTLFTFEILDKDMNLVRDFSTVNPQTFRVGYNNSVYFQSIQLRLDVGNYYMRVKDGNGNVLSLCYPFHVYDGPWTTDFETYLTLIDSDNAEFSRPDMGVYAGEVIIPDSFEDRKVSRIAADALNEATMLESLTVPASITRLGSGDLYNTPRLRKLTMLSATPASISPLLMPESHFPRVALHVPADAENAYMHSDVWNRFAMPSWQLDIPEGVTVSGLQTDPETGLPYQPYFIGRERGLSFDITLPEDKVAVVWWTIAETNEQHWHSMADGTVTLPVLGDNHGIFSLHLADAASIDTVEGADGTVTVFTTTGICLMRHAAPEALETLAPGIYIVNGRKTVIH